MKKVKDMVFLVHNEDDMKIITRILFVNKKRCFVVPVRHDLINVDYHVVTNLLKTSEIQKVLRRYRIAGGYEEPIVKIR